MKNQIIIGSVQMPTKESASKNIDTMHSYLDHISKNLPQIKMVVFPELASADFTKKPIDQAEPIPGEKTKIFSEFAKLNIRTISDSLGILFKNNIFKCSYLSNLTAVM